MIRIVPIDELDPRLWRELLENCPGETPFHGLPWIRSVSESDESLEAGFYLWTDREGEVVAVMPFFTGRRLIFDFRYSLPFGSYGGPLFRRDLAPGVREKAEREIFHRYFRENPSLFTGTRQVTCFEAPARGCLPAGVVSAERFTHLVDLDVSEDQLWRKRYRHRVRKFVNQAKKHGIEVRRAEEESDVWQFARLAELTQLRKGSTPYPPEFFLNLFRNGRQDGSVMVHTAQYGNRVIAGVIHLATEEMLFNFLTASDERFWHLRPNHLLVDHMIRLGIGKGKKLYNFGGSPAAAAGLISYKESFGAKIRYYSSHSLKGPVFSAIGRLAGLLSRRRT